MRKWIFPVTVVVALGAFGLGWTAARPKAAATPKLTADDYFEIQQLYGRYTHSIDHGEKDGMDYAATFVPDGVLVFVGPAATPCRHDGDWEAATREDMRGSIADVKNIDVCVMKLTGTKKLAALAAGFKMRQERHVHTNFLFTPTAEGATGWVYLSQLNVLTRPPTWSGNGGIYTDTLVRTPNGWRFKKRISTTNAVWMGQGK
jgi:hypothetical protein